MNENNINVQNEEAKPPIYSSKFLMSKELFYDFSLVSYNRMKKMFLIFFGLVAYVIGINLMLGNYDMLFIFGPFTLFTMILIYFMMIKTTKIGYERMVISEGKEPTWNYEFFEDKVVSHRDEFKREFFYDQITKFFETKHFILLHLKYNLHIVIDKNNLNTGVDEIKSFLMNRCTLVKDKKFINCTNDKKWSLALLLTLIVVSVVGMVAALLLKTHSTI